MLSCPIDMPLELTQEAEIKLKTLAESLNFENESAVVNDLFYQFVLNQEPEKRKMIMAVYQINVKGTSGIIRYSYYAYPRYLVSMYFTK